MNPMPLERLRKAGVIALAGGEKHVQPDVQSALDSINESVGAVVP